MAMISRRVGALWLLLCLTPVVPVMMGWIPGRIWAEEKNGSPVLHEPTLEVPEARPQVGLQDSAIHESANCGSEFPEPIVPGLPNWAKGKTLDQCEGAGATRVMLPDGKPSGAVYIGTEMVIKTCNAATLEACVEMSKPAIKISAGSMDPTWDIFFDCGNNSKYVIKVTQTLMFGSGSNTSHGTYRMIAPDLNVELNGSKKFRIALIYKNADLTVSGLTFRNGRQVNMETDKSKIPTLGAYKGAAICATLNSKLTVHKCKFYNNLGLSHYAVMGRGGAIGGDVMAIVKIWGSHFQKNAASTGGAVGVTNIGQLHIAQSKFVKNEARGGIYEGSIEKGYDKPFILVKGGAVRVDSVRGYDSKEPHLLFCNNEFIGNAVSFKSSQLPDFGYETTDADYVRATGAAITCFNKAGMLNLSKGDTSYVVARDCTFKNNKHKVNLTGGTRRRVGSFVFEVEGAGDVEVNGMKFEHNNVDEAVTRFHTVQPKVKSMKAFKYDLSNMSFNGNAGENVEFISSKHDSTCTIKNLDGVNDGTRDCFKV